jgi:hypothetical protein
MKSEYESYFNDISEKTIARIIANTIIYVMEIAEKRFNKKAIK